MPSPINTLPLGLLDFLTAKTLGRNPAELADTVLPTLPLQQFYIAAQLERVQSAQFTVAAVGSTFSTMTVPNSEIWLIDQCTASTVTLGAGIACRFRVAVADPLSQRTYIGESSGAIAATERGHSRITQTFIAPSGSQFGITAEQLTGAGFDAVVLASIVRLTV